MEQYKKLTIASYDENAEFYSQKHKNLFDLYRRDEFKRFIEFIQGKNILDLGSGNGEHADYFRKNGFIVTCVDLSDKMIELCKGKGLNAFVMDIENLEFDDNLFDGIWAVTSLLHVPKPKLFVVIDKLHKILKDKGILYVCVKEGEGERVIESVGDSKRFFSFWKEDELLKVFEKHFSLVEFKRVVLGNRTFLEFFFRNSS